MNWYKQSQFKSIREKLIELKNVIGQETSDTKDMIQTYYNWVKGRATPEEISEANNQVKDLLKGSILASLFLVPLPGMPLVIVGLAKLAKKFGIDLMPSSFRGGRR